MLRRVFCLLAGLALSIPCSAQDQATSKKAVERRLANAEKKKASSAIDHTIRALEAATGISQVALSPDGKAVAWVQDLREKNQVNSGNSAIFVRRLDQKTPARKITAALAPRAESDVAWAPDSRRLAFLSDAINPGQKQL